MCNESLTGAFDSIVNGFGSNRRKLFEEAWEHQAGSSKHYHVLLEQLLQPAATAGLRIGRAEKDLDPVLVLASAERALGLLEVQDHNIPLVTGVAHGGGARESEQNFVKRMRSHPPEVTLQDYLRLVHDVMLPTMRHEVELFRRNQPETAAEYDAMAVAAWEQEKRPRFLKAAATLENDSEALKQLKFSAYRQQNGMNDEGFPLYSEHLITEEEWAKAERMDRLEAQKTHARVNRQQMGGGGRSH